MPSAFVNVLWDLWVMGRENESLLRTEEYGCFISERGGKAKGRQRLKTEGGSIEGKQRA